MSWSDDNYYEPPDWAMEKFLQETKEDEQIEKRSKDWRYWSIEDSRKKNGNVIRYRQSPTGKRIKTYEITEQERDEILKTKNTLDTLKELLK